MPALIVAIPLFDNKMTVKAYKMCGHNTDITLDIRDDFRGRSQIYYLPGLEVIQKVGLEPFSGERPLFVETNRFHILTGMFTNKNIPADKLILTIPASISTDDKLLAGLFSLQELGYSIALDGYPVNGGLADPLVKYIDHIILDYRDKRFREQFREIKTRLPNIQTILFNIPDMDVYSDYATRTNTLFTGGFYTHPITESEEEISPLKVNALDLLRQINAEDFELKNITQIVERDPSLSISLLRFINSPAVGLRSKVNSISNAVALLGQKEIRRWAIIAISVGIYKDKPSEITKLSLVRAKFAENLATLFEMGIFQNSLFMTGLFSLLDIILKKPMAEAVNEIAVDSLVREALVDNSGSLYRVLDFIYAYERADWNKATIILVQNSIIAEDVGQAYIDAVVWYHNLLESINETEETAQEGKNG